MVPRLAGPSTIGTFSVGGPAMNKRCPECRECKSREEFSKNRRKKDGLSSYCKVCRNERRRAWAESNPEKATASSRRWKRANLNHVREYNQNWAEENRDTVNSRIQEWKLRNPHKVAAQRAVRREINRGSIPHPSTLPCHICGSVASDYHHSSYKVHDHLNVIPMCRACHAQWHRRHTPTRDGMSYIEES